MNRPLVKQNKQVAIVFDEKPELSNIYVTPLKVEKEVPAESTGKATPFLKWVGGKRSLIDELKARLPDEFNNYFEPFVGGGALFFELHSRLKSAHLSDMNFDLIITYSVIQKDLPKLIEQLKIHQAKHSETYYYKVRSMHNLEDPIQIAARMIYLNKTCFNGLWRVNSKGEFNVPIGSYSNPGILQEDNLNHCRVALSRAKIENKEYFKINPAPGDFVYFDPPYHPTSETSFTRYSKQDFSEKDQSDLADFCIELHKKGVFVMVSNSDTSFIKNLYKASYFNIGIVNAPRLVNCKPNGRNSVQEVLITNY
ncbi:MAG: DNA adenine methylase [Bacteroidetes bacterium]|nr:DNA adenine methylase [Bacteroidota bacterium]